MNKSNYDALMLAEIKNIAKEKKPRLLLHSCCAPCSSTAIERLKDYFDITVYYYNPNIDSIKEFEKRVFEQQRFCAQFELRTIIPNHNSKEFFESVKGYEDCNEGGERCFICYKLRLEKTAKTAFNEGFDYFATTLTLSPLKNAEKLNEIGFALSEKYDVKYLPTDFKKRGGYLRSIELSKEHQLYRQNYCGCVFSKRELPTDIN